MSLSQELSYFEDPVSSDSTYNAMENYDETFHDVLTGANWEYQDPSLEKLMLELFGDIFLPNNSDEHAAVQTPQTPPTPPTQPTPPNPPTPPTLPIPQTPTFPADQNNLCQTQQEVGPSMSAQGSAHAQTFEPVCNVPRAAASTLPAAPPLQVRPCFTFWLWMQFS